MDRRGGRKRARVEEAAAAAVTVAGKKKAKVEAQDVAFEEAVVAKGEAWQKPPGVFEFPWMKCRGGLGVPAAGGGFGWELWDVFFCSLVDGNSAAIGMPGDRLSPPPSKRTLFDDVEAWLAAADDGEVDPIWRSVLEGPRTAA